MACESIQGIWQSMYSSKEFEFDIWIIWWAELLCMQNEWMQVMEMLIWKYDVPNLTIISREIKVRKNGSWKTYNLLHICHREGGSECSRVRINNYYKSEWIITKRCRLIHYNNTMQWLLGAPQELLCLPCWDLFCFTLSLLSTKSVLFVIY